MRPRPRTQWPVFFLLSAVVVCIQQGCLSAEGNGNAGIAGSTGGSAGATGTAGTSAGAGGPGRGGVTGTAGAAGRGGTTGAGGTTAAAGTSGTAAATGAALCQWPTAVGSMAVSATIPVSGTYDGGMKRFTGTGALGTSGQGEAQDPMFNLASGATLQNVIIGAPAADGVHCNGTCTLRNVWWEDVGEDAATLKGSSTTQVMTIDGSGARKAADKVFQHNGPGTMIVQNFCAQDFGKLYRSCGNCTTQYERHVQFKNVMVIPSGATDALAGVNTNYNDSATFSTITIKGTTNSIDICQRYTGNNTGAEPTRTGSGADGTACIYAASDITWAP
jgi:pectate lyase